MSQTEDDDFVFKPAAISPKLSNSDGTVNSNINSISASQSINQSQSIPTQTNVRYSFLDNFINEKKKEMDSELNELSKERLEEFLKREKEADKQREKEFQLRVNSPKNEHENRDFTSKSDYELLDKKEEELFKVMKEQAKETWKELRQEYQKSLEQLHLEQSARLSQELQLQESLQASGRVFDRDLFEKVVEKCGKGRATAFGKEKMARFWEILDKSYPKNTSAMSPNKLDDDKVLASLLGL